VSTPLYVVVQTDHISDLEAQVNARLLEGFRPVGSLVLKVAETEEGGAFVIYHQPMLLEPGVADVEEAPQRKKFL
jgi:hypothetical protein